MPPPIGYSSRRPSCFMTSIARRTNFIFCKDRCCSEHNGSHTLTTRITDTGWPMQCALQPGWAFINSKPRALFGRDKCTCSLWQTYRKRTRHPLSQAVETHLVGYIRKSLSTFLGFGLLMNLSRFGMFCAPYLGLRTSGGLHLMTVIPSYSTKTTGRKRKPPSLIAMLAFSPPSPGCKNCV